METDPRQPRNSVKALLDMKWNGAVAFGRQHLNWTAHKAQEQIMLDKSKYKVVSAGRRFGKSEMCSVDLLYFALTKNASTQFIISATQDQANIIFETLVRFATKTEFLRNTVEKISRANFPFISFVNGSEIHARTTKNPDYIRGHHAHRIFIDEAAYVKDGIIDPVIMPLLADYDGEMVVISTPKGRNDFFNMFELGRDQKGGFKSWQFPSTANPHISHSFVEKQKEKMLDIEFRTEWLGEFIDDQLCVFKWEYINRAMEEYHESYERIPGHAYYIGIDVAKTYDFTVITVIDGTNPSECSVVYCERFNNRPYSFVVERVFAIAAQFNPLRITVDETGVGVGPTESICENLPAAEGFTFSMPAKISLINTLRLGFERGRIRFSNQNRTLEDELRYYQFELNEETQNLKMKAAKGKHDDCVISLALAFLPISVGTYCNVVGAEKPIFDKGPITEYAKKDSVYPNIPTLWGDGPLLVI